LSFSVFTDITLLLFIVVTVVIVVVAVVFIVVVVFYLLLLTLYNMHRFMLSSVIIILEFCSVLLSRFKTVRTISVTLCNLMEKHMLLLLCNLFVACILCNKLHTNKD
jgi:hypothetical protein